MTSPAPTSDILIERQSAAATWFRALRDNICATFEALDADAPATLYGHAPGRFERTPWTRDEGGAKDGGGGRNVDHEGPTV